MALPGEAPAPGGIEVAVFRHLESAQTALNTTLSTDPMYLEFRELFADDPFGDRTGELAATINENFPIASANADLPLVDGQVERGRAIGRKLSELHAAGEIDLPDRIVTSGVVRTRETGLAVVSGFPELAERVADEPGMFTHDDRLREKSTGVAELYTDTKIFQALHPEVLEDRVRLGKRSKFDLRNPGGENVPDVMARAAEWDAERNPDERTWVFSHMIWTLAYRLVQEGVQADDPGASDRYRHLLYEEAPKTGAVTTYERSSVGGLVVARLNEVLA